MLLDGLFLYCIQNFLQQSIELFSFLWHYIRYKTILGKNISRYGNEQINLNVINYGGEEMKSFISLLISFIFMSIADSIDSAFNYAISIDAIVVCGSLFSVDLILKSISEIGIFTYRTDRKNESAYLIINVIVGLILGAIVFFLRNIIVNIFNLNDIQRKLLSNVLALYIVYLTIGRLANAIFEMVRLKDKLKLYRKSLILYYVSLIALDFIAFIITKNLIVLFIATILSWVISIIYMLYNLKLELILPNGAILRNVIKIGVPTCLERLLSRIFILIYGVLASNLGTEKYSVHTVCYTTILKLELIANAFQATLMIELPKYKNANEQYKHCVAMKNKCFALIIFLDYLLGALILVISHGSLPIIDCFPYIIFYSVGMFGLYLYTTYQTLLIVQGKPKIMLIGSVVGAGVRVILCQIFLNSSISLYVFGISNFVDFYIRSIIYRIGLSKSYNTGVQ